MTIWKFVLEISDIQEIQMPGGADILSVAEQDGRLCLWALVDPGAIRECRKVWIIVTGNPFPEAVELHFIGTVPMHGGALIWHVFEEID